VKLKKRTCLVMALCFFAGCALVTHDLGSVRTTRPGGEQVASPITKDVSKALREENRDIEKWMDSPDGLQNKLEISKFSDAEICLSMVEIQLPSKNVFEKPSNPISSHNLTLVRSDGLELKDAKLSDLGDETIILRFTAPRNVVVGQEQTRDATGAVIATTEKTEWKTVEDKVELHRFTGKVCFATNSPFITPAIKWLKLKMAAKLYANEYTFNFE
jgi:hypothetical protein